MRAETGNGRRGRRGQVDFACRSSSAAAALIMVLSAACLAAVSGACPAGIEGVGCRVGRELVGGRGKVAAMRDWWGEGVQQEASGSGGKVSASPILCRASPTMRLRGGGSITSAASRYLPSLSLSSKSLKFQMSMVERKSVDDIKEALGSELKDVSKRNPELASDDRILRFLRSYKHDVQKTVGKMKEMLDWRRKHDTDLIRDLVVRHWNEDFWKMACIPRRDFFRKMYLMEPNYAVTSGGDLVSVEYTGAIDIRAFMSQATEHEIIRFWCYLMEWNMIKLARLSKKHGKIARMVQIKDLYGQNLWQCTCKVGMERFQKINRMLHLVYPETLNKLVVANVPGVFGVMFNIFKPLMPKRTLRKIDILGEGDEALCAFGALLGPDNQLSKSGRAEALFSDVLAGRLEQQRRRSKAITAFFGSALALLAFSRASFVKDEQVLQASRSRSPAGAR